MTYATYATYATTLPLARLEEEALIPAPHHDDDCPWPGPPPPRRRHTAVLLLVLLANPGCPWPLPPAGDTRPCQRLEQAGRGATLLIHEATFEPGLLQMAQSKRHSTSEEAVGAARGMQVRAGRRQRR